MALVANYFSEHEAFIAQIVKFCLISNRKIIIISIVHISTESSKNLLKIFLFTVRLKNPVIFNRNFSVHRLTAKYAEKKMNAGLDYKTIYEK